MSQITQTLFAGRIVYVCLLHPTPEQPVDPQPAGSLTSLFTEAKPFANEMATQPPFPAAIREHEDSFPAWCEGTAPQSPRGAYLYRTCGNLARFCWSKVETLLLYPTCIMEVGVTNPPSWVSAWGIQVPETHEGKRFTAKTVY